METLIPRHRAALVLMAASGFAGLGYQLVWTQQSALWLGHEAAAVLAVVAAFFGGIAVGALVFGERIERSPLPLRWYAACEAAIAAWALLLLVLSNPFSAWVLWLIGEQPSAAWQWTVAFGATFLLLLPATAAMGATLPAIERVTASMRGESRPIAPPPKKQRSIAPLPEEQRSIAPRPGEQRSIAPLYAANTLGAVLGVLATAFWLVPAIGLTRTAALCITLNATCAVAAWFVLTRSTAPLAAPPMAAVASSAASRRAALARLAATGLLGIGYEVVVVRVLGQVAEDTVYTFALLLAVYLVGTALGAASYARLQARSAGDERTGDRLLAALAIACLAGTMSLWAAERVRDAAQHALGGGMAAALGSEAVLAMCAFALPTVAMGALFSHLARQVSAAGISFGRALGYNTIGAAAAPLVFGVLLAPWLGAKAVLLVIALAYLALASRVARLRPVVLAPAAVVLATAFVAPRLAFIDVPEGGRIVSYAEGAMASVSVVEDAAGVARLRIDNHAQEGSSATRFVDGRQALLPMLLHPAPKRALFLGLGTGVTASTAAGEAAVEVDAVELLPEVIAASAHFTQPAQQGTPNPRLHLVAADARRWVKITATRYDVIVADNFHPARSGSGALYTVEHFDAVRARLAGQGLFCQWLPLHQLDLATVRSIVRSFMAAFPEGSAILASNSLQTPVLGLLGRAEGGRIDVAAVRERLRTIRSTEALAAYGLDDELALLGSFVAGPSALARFAAGAGLNTDDHPVVAYRAPRITYAPDSLPEERLSSLLHALAFEPKELLAAGGDAAFSQRLAAYAAARDLFIEAGRGVVPSGDVRSMLAQVREPLLAVLRTSPDFRPARDPLLRMAAVLDRVDPAAAEALRADLAGTPLGRVPARVTSLP